MTRDYNYFIQTKYIGDIHGSTKKYLREFYNENSPINNNDIYYYPCNNILNKKDYTLYIHEIYKKIDNAIPFNPIKDNFAIPEKTNSYNNQSVIPNFNTQKPSFNNHISQSPSFSTPKPNLFKNIALEQNLEKERKKQHSANIKKLTALTIINEKANNLEDRRNIRNNIKNMSPDDIEDDIDSFESEDLITSIRSWIGPAAAITGKSIEGLSELLGSNRFKNVTPELINHFENTSMLDPLILDVVINSSNSLNLLVKTKPIADIIKILILYDNNKNKKK